MSKPAKQSEKPEEKKTITTQEHNYTLIMDRIITFHTLSMNRAVQARDPPTLLDAGDTLGIIIKNKKVQDTIKAEIFKITDDEDAEEKEGEDKKPEQD